MAKQNPLAGWKLREIDDSHIPPVEKAILYGFVYLCLFALAYRYLILPLLGRPAENAPAGAAAPAPADRFVLSLAHLLVLMGLTALGGFCVGARSGVSERAALQLPAYAIVFAVAYRWLLLPILQAHDAA